MAKRRPSLDQYVVRYTWADGSSDTLPAELVYQKLVKDRRRAGGIKRGGGPGRPKTKTRPSTEEIYLAISARWLDKGDLSDRGRKRAIAWLIDKLSKEHKVTVRAARGWVAAAIKYVHSLREK